MGGAVGSDPGEKDFTALSTSRLINVSREEFPGGTDTAGTGFVGALGIALGAAFLVAVLFLSSSNSLQRVVRISTVSLRSFFSVASLLTSSLQASRSTRMFSFSNSSGVRASVALPFLICLVLEATGAEAAIAATAGTAAVMSTTGTDAGLMEEKETVTVDASDDDVEVVDEISGKLGIWIL